jgi:hypothetical protein
MSASDELGANSPGTFSASVYNLNVNGTLTANGVGATFNSLTVGTLDVTADATIQNLDVANTSTVGGLDVVTSSQTRVTQVGLQTNPVTANGSTVEITTVSLTTPAFGSTSFLLNNNFITTSSIILLSIAGYSGTGVPSLWVSQTNPTNGQIHITIGNAEGAPLNNTMRITVLVA